MNNESMSSVIFIQPNQTVHSEIIKDKYKKTLIFFELKKCKLEYGFESSI